MPVTAAIGTHATRWDQRSSRQSSNGQVSPQVGRKKNEPCEYIDRCGFIWISQHYSVKKIQAESVQKSFRDEYCTFKTAQVEIKKKEKRVTGRHCTSLWEITIFSQKWNQIEIIWLRQYQCTARHSGNHPVSVKTLWTPWHCLYVAVRLGLVVLVGVLHVNMIMDTDDGTGGDTAYRCDWISEWQEVGAQARIWSKWCVTAVQITLIWTRHLLLGTYMTDKDKELTWDKDIQKSRLLCASPP